MEINNFGFKINNHDKKLYTDIVTEGRHYVGPGRYFVEFSKETYTVLFCSNCSQYANSNPNKDRFLYDSAIKARTFEGIQVVIYFYLEFGFKIPADGNMEDQMYLWYRRAPSEFMELVSSYTRFYVSYYCQRFPISKFYEDRLELNENIQAYVSKKMLQTLRLNVTDLGMLNIDIPNDIEAEYENTKAKEQEFIRSVNEINVLTEELKGKVKVSSTNADSVRQVADIQANIVLEDGTVRTQVIASKVEYDSDMISAAKTNLLLDQTQTGVTYNGTSNSDVSENDQIMAYWYTKNYTSDNGYKRINNATS